MCATRLYHSSPFPLLFFLFFSSSYSFSVSFSCFSRPCRHYRPSRYLSLFRSRPSLFTYPSRASLVRCHSHRFYAIFVRFSLSHVIFILLLLVLCYPCVAFVIPVFLSPFSPFSFSHRSRSSFSSSSSHSFFVSLI